MRKKSRHKLLKKKINLWKAEFENLHGRPAETSDIEEDNTLREQYAEYLHLREEIHELDGTTNNNNTLNGTMTLNGGGGVSPSATYVSPSPSAAAAGTSSSPNNNNNEQQQQQQQESSPEEIKKMLKHKLNTWKKEFKNNNGGREATEADISADAEMKAVYEDYLTLKSALANNNNNNTNENSDQTLSGEV